MRDSILPLKIMRLLNEISKKDQPSCKGGLIVEVGMCVCVLCATYFPRTQAKKHKNKKSQKEILKKGVYCRAS